jgi:hypothetical protein
MAIPPLSQRLDSMLPASQEQPQPQSDDPLGDILPKQTVEEYEPVAGLVDKLVLTPAKIIRQGVRITPQVSDQAGARAAQEAVQGAAVAAEREATPGAVQAVRRAVAPRRRPAQPPAAQQPMPPATQQEMATAIQAADDALAAPPVSVAPAMPEPVGPEVPGVVIRAVTPEDADKFLSGVDAPAVGVDFNFNYIQAPEDIDKIIDATSKAFASQTDAAKRGVVGDDALKDMAARLNIAPELLQMRTGDTLSAEKLLAARHLLVRSAKSLDELSTRIRTMAPGTEDDNLLLQFRNQLATHAAIQMRLKAAQTETARALRSFRLPVDGTSGLSDPNQITALLNEMGGRANMKNLATAYQQLTLDQQARFTEMAGTTTQQIGKIWKEMYLSSLMYSPATTERALFGNMILSLARGLDTAFASTAGRAADTVITPIFGSNSADSVTMTEAIVEMANFFHSLPKGLSAGLKSFVEDAPIYKVGRDVEKTPDPALSAKLFADPNTPMAHAVDFLGKAVRLPFRSMMAVDEMGKAMIAQMETRRLAARDALTAIRNGVNVDTALDGMAMQISAPDARTLDRVHQGVLDGTLQTDLGAFGQGLTKLRNDLGPVGTVLAPFIKTVINAQKQMLARTPVMNFFLKDIREDMAAGGARRQMALGKMSQGAAFMGYGYYLALDGTITGAGPTDPNRRKFLQETTGWMPFSIRVGKTEDGRGIYRSYAGLEPIGGMLGMSATLAEIGAVYGKEDDDEWRDLLLYSALLPFKYIGELPFMQSMTNFTDMVEHVVRNPKGEETSAAANKFFGGMAQNFPGGVVPVPMPAGGLVRQIENVLDPTKREVTLDASLPPEQRYFDFMFRTWVAKTPLMSKDIPPSRNLWGQEVKTGEPDALSFIIPFNKKERDLDSVENKLLEIAKARQRFPLNKPERTVANIKLNDAEYSNLLLLMNNTLIDGKNFYGAVAATLTNPEHVEQMKHGAYEGVANKLSKVMGDYRDAAINSPAFEKTHPDAYQQIQLNRMLAERKYQQTQRKAVAE